MFEGSDSEGKAAVGGRNGLRDDAGKGVVEPASVLSSSCPNPEGEWREVKRKVSERFRVLSHRSQQVCYNQRSYEVLCVDINVE